MLSILWRGPLSSCNYDCAYCPFAKHVSSRAELAADKAALARFEGWATEHEGLLSVFFTPWGEALIRRYYRDALLRMSRLAHLKTVAIQTNLSSSVEWMVDAGPSLALWATFHPTQVTMERFVDRVRWLLAHDISLSVGIVGKEENLEAAKALRDALPSEVYLWVNAYKSEGADYYRDGTERAFEAIDPLFPLNAIRHPSRGRACHTGESVISVDGEGAIRRCHFVSEVLGNLYEDDLSSILRPRLCPNATCGCHIGYVHMPHLEVASVYGNGLLPRIPEKGRPRALPVLDVDGDGRLAVSASIDCGPTSSGSAVMKAGGR